MASNATYNVMLSSTYVELKEHRRAVSDAMIGQRLLPLAMDFDAALPDQDLIEASLAKVNAADAYVGLISYRYGQRPKCTTRNSDRLSLTELEFRRAVEREIPICMFIMHPKHPIPSEEAHKEHGARQKLRAFVKLAKTNRIYAEFESIADLKSKAVQSLAKLQDVLEQRATAKGREPTRVEASITTGDPLPPVKALVVRPPRCIGRDEETRALIDVLVSDAGSIAVLVLGGPGMGKTTVTREAASRPEAIGKFGQRRWFVELETAINAEALEKAIVVALGLDPASARFDAALARLGQTSGLLVLDNLETPWDGERDKVEAVLATLHRVPDLTILASIRGNEPPAGVRWTRQRTMHPLESPHDQEMFLDIARDIKPDDPHFAPLLTLLAGVPIAIELVAQQAAAHDTLAAVHGEWLRVGSALAKRRGVEPSRLSSLEVSLELSYRSDQLGDAGRRLFGVLGQLPAGIAPHDLSALLGDRAFDARQGLLSTALAVERSDRLDLLPPVRDHARRLHPPSTEDIDLWRKHYLALAREQGGNIGGAEGAGAVGRLAPELPNLDAAQRAALSAGQLDEAAKAVLGLARLMSFTGLGTETTIRDLAIACRARGDAFGEAECIERLGDIALARSNHDGARKAFEQALPLYRQVQNDIGEANCIQSLGDIALDRSDYDTARKAYEKSLPLYRKVGNVLGEANCIFRLGDVALQRSDHDDARKAYEQALPLYRQIGNGPGEANCVIRLGEIAFGDSDHDAARKAYEQALPLYRQMGDVLGEATCTKCLGDIALARAAQDAARKAYEQALTLYRQVGNVIGEANCVSSLGDIARARSDHEAARKAYELALGLYQRVEDPYSIGNTHLSLREVTEGSARDAHRAAAREAWLSIGREDLVKKHGLSE